MTVTAVGGTIALAAVTLVATNLIKFIRGRDWNGVVSTIVPGFVGFGAAWLVAQTRWGEQMSFNGAPLRSLSIADLLVLGVVVGSGLAGAGWQVIKALDNTQSTATPDIIAPRAPVEQTTTTTSTTRKG